MGVGLAAMLAALPAAGAAQAQEREQHNPPLLWWTSQASLHGGQASMTAGGFAAAPAALPGDAYVLEYALSWPLDMVGAAAAHARGLTGQGVLVAVIDSGIDTAHPEFAGRISPLSRDFGEEDDGLGVEDRDGHGTHVAGIIGAARNGYGMVGVAYDSTILALRAIAVEEDDEDDAASNRALHYAAAVGAGVINGSYGPLVPLPRLIEDPNDPGSEIPNPNYFVLPHHIVHINGLEEEFLAVRAAAEADAVLVFAAGNEYLDQPIYAQNPAGIGLFPYLRPENHRNGVYVFNIQSEDYEDADPSTWEPIDPDLPDLDDIDLSELQGALITVVATDRNGQIASYSNRCGVAWMWCIAAPGGEIAEPGDNPLDVEVLSTYPGQSYETMPGTSMAAPVVSGGAAILRQAFPYMTARQIIEIILTTADSLGDPSIYGRGMFNLGRAIDGPAEFGAEGFAHFFDVDTKGHDSIWSGNITGSGGLIKRGDGTLALLGDSTYQGGTTVDGGTLMVGGSLASDVMVATTGRLVGNGTLGANLEVEGEVTPGNGVIAATMTVGGDLRLSESSRYSVSVRGDDHDRLAVGDQAILEGGALSVDLGGNAPSLTQALSVITTGGGVSGTFGTLSTTSQSHFLDPRLAYGNAVTLHFDRNSETFESVALSGNAAAFARMLDTSGAGSAVDSVLVAQSASVAAAGLTVLSGEIHAAGQAALLDRSRHLRGAAQARIQSAFSSAPSGTVATYGPDGAERIAANHADGLALWAQGIGASGRVNADSNGSTFSHSHAGLLIGADYGVLPNARLGAVIGYGGSRFRTLAASDGKADSVDFGIYGGAHWGDVKLAGGLAYGRHGIETTRSITSGGFDERATARYNAHSFQAFGDIGYDIQMGHATLQPFASLAHARLRSRGFAEQGGLAALSSSGLRNDATWTTLGARVALPVSVPASWGDVAVTVNGSAGWRRTFGNAPPAATLSMAGLPGFTVQAAAPNRNAAVLELGVDVAVAKRTSLGLSYSGILARGSRDSRLALTATHRF